jgi:hypothetical protein
MSGWQLEPQNTTLIAVHLENHRSFDRGYSAAVGKTVAGAYGYRTHQGHLG